MKCQVRALLRAFPALFALLAVAPQAVQAQSPGELRVAFDSVSAQFEGITPGVIDADPATRHVWPSVDVNAVSMDARRSAFPKSLAFAEAFNCEPTCLLRGGIEATVAFVGVSRSAERLTLGATVRYNAGGDAAAPALAWFEVDVVRRDGELIAIVRLVANS